MHRLDLPGGNGEVGAGKRVVGGVRAPSGAGAAAVGTDSRGGIVPCTWSATDHAMASRPRGSGHDVRDAEACAADVEGPRTFTVEKTERGSAAPGAAPGIVATGAASR